MWPVTVIVLILSGVIVTLAVFTCAILTFELKEALSWSSIFEKIRQIYTNLQTLK
jgi:hypothetical protein